MKTCMKCKTDLKQGASRCAACGEDYSLSSTLSGIASAIFGLLFWGTVAFFTLPIAWGLLNYHAGR